MATEMFLKTKAAIRIVAVPVRRIGFVLKALIYPIPRTVPGIAKVRREDTYIIPLPGNLFLEVR